MAQAHFRPAPGASTVSTMQAARASGAVPAWIHPRSLGLTEAMTPLALMDVERRGACDVEGALAKVKVSKNLTYMGVTYVAEAWAGPVYSTGEKE